MIGILTPVTALLLIALTGWCLGWWKGIRLLYLPWLGLVAVLGLCGLFHCCPELAPPLLAGRVAPLTNQFVADHPLLGLLGQYPWLILGLIIGTVALPYLVRLHAGLRSLVFAVSSGRRLVRDLPADIAALPAPRRVAATPPTLRIGLVGPWRGGKSELIDQACLELSRPLQCPRLALTVEDPTLLNGLLQKRRRREVKIAHRPRVSTVRPCDYPLTLLEAGRPRLRLKLRDPIGQLVQFTTPAAPTDLRHLCDAYQSHLATVDVLWLVLPCPSREERPDEMQAFLDAVQTTRAYVQAALEQRSVEHPLALAVVLSRIDARYDSAAAARERLPHEVIAGLTRLLQPLLGHPRLGEVVLVPVSAWGFGRGTMQREPGLTWTLRQTPRPFNVTGLLLWSMAAGLGYQPVPGSAAEAGEWARLHRLLNDELARGAHWIVPISAS
jgi:hypothetical protein